LNNKDSGGPGATPAALGTTPETAAETGVTLKTTIERGDAYLSPQLYNVEITLLQTIRGEAAAERVRSQKISSKPPLTGFDFVLAHIRLGYFRRVRGLEDEVYTLTEGQFMAVSPDGKTEYPLPSVSSQPQPPLIEVTFNPGDTREGWILLQAPAVEKRPLLVFKRQHVEGAYGIWGYVWIRL
jgi:hypothetical protein